MILLPKQTLPSSPRNKLIEYQAEIDAIGLYEERVIEAKNKFQSRNVLVNMTFAAVRRTLSAMCSGSRRCMYCEDSVADEVEHIKPKDLYPDAVFVWDNYLYACGPCNGGKRNKFLVLVPPGSVENVTRRSGDAVAPPRSGDPVFINPRDEDALLFMKLDLAGTFRFVPTAAPQSVAHIRALHTLDILKLNERDYLISARRQAYGSYVARLSQYITERESLATTQRLAQLRNALLRMGHPTVWAEMKRQHPRIRRLSDLFSRCPEALIWEI